MTYQLTDTNIQIVCVAPDWPVLLAEEVYPISLNINSRGRFFWEIWKFIDSSKLWRCTVLNIYISFNIYSSFTQWSLGLARVTDYWQPTDPRLIKKIILPELNEWLQNWRREILWPLRRQCSCAGEKVWAWWWWQVLVMKLGMRGRGGQARPGGGARCVCVRGREAEKMEKLGWVCIYKWEEECEWVSMFGEGFNIRLKWHKEYFVDYTCVEVRYERTWMVDTLFISHVNITSAS